LNPDGTITVAPNTPAGDYELEYSICEVLNPDNCATATVTVTVEPAVIEANENDFGPINGTDGGTTPSVLGNDTLNGDPLDPADVTLTVVSSDPELTLNPDGTITVAPNTPAGDYELTYSICEVLNPDNCATATVTVTVEPAVIEANENGFGPINGTDGGTTPSVLGNDTLNGDPLDPADVTLTAVSSDPELTLNPDGTITVAPNTPAGDYELEYSICEVLNPDNCATATVTVTVEPAVIEANENGFGPINGTDGGTTPSVLGNDTLNGDPVDPADVTLTVVSSDPELTLNPDGTITVAPNTPAGEYTLEYRVCDVMNPDNCSTATVTVTVTASEIVANDDDLGIHTTDFAGDLGNILLNDRLNGLAIDPSLVDFEIFDLGGLTGLLIGPDGSLSLIPGLNQAGRYLLQYRVCEVLNPTNCDTAYITIVLEASEVDLSITKTSNDVTIWEGDEFEYVITVSNIGLTDATDVVIIDN
ncbi:hypothetical protein MM213_20630, partial [Belliella sp. R4-6]|nr:hypothetical protein [Belliella alkalica]